MINSFSRFSVLFYLCAIFVADTSLAANLVIQIPEITTHNSSGYRLDYSPPFGNPRPNSTFAAKDVGDVIHFSDGLPGTRYDFLLYFSNATGESPTWTASIITPPDPPTNLTVHVWGGKTAQIDWTPPQVGGYSGYKMKVISLSESSQTKTITLPQSSPVPYTLKDLTPGGSYQIQLFTIYDNKESVAYISKNFTTKPSTPGKFIVWFRNETTLLVLWQPSYPASIFSHYKVSIDPPDANESVLFVEREGEPPGPAQAAFKGLIPGRAYNISVQTVSEEETSTPTTAQYRTIPLKPLTLTYDKSSLSSYGVRVTWEPPKGVCEFDKYQISLNTRRQSGASTVPINRGRDEPTVCDLNEGLEPGRTYQILVKTFSAKVASWPATLNVTLQPLPVKNLQTEVNHHTGDVRIKWKVDNASYQESYKISYLEAESLNGDSNIVYVDREQCDLESLLPGRNYSITVQAISNQIEGNETTIFQATWPSSPVIEELKSTEFGLNISWKSDVNSRQENYLVFIRRNDTASLEPSFVNTTTESKLVLRNLYPGAGYHIKVIAVSHGLRSEPHDYFQAVYPRPPRNLLVEKVASNSVLLRWEKPIDSLFSEYSIRYKTDEDERWIRLPGIKGALEAEITDMTPGERYTVQVNTVSYGIESIHPLQINHTVHPNPVSDIVTSVDSTFIDLKFPRPEGRIEYYVINYVSTDAKFGKENRQIFSKQIPEDGTKKDDKYVKIPIEDLMPGLRYSVKIQTVSYGLESEVTSLEARTLPLILSEISVINNPEDTSHLTLRYTPVPQNSSHFDLYRFVLSDPLIPAKEKLANDEERKVTFDNLIPGRLYNITVWTVADGVTSHPLQRQDRLYPEAITNLNASSITDVGINLIWDPPRGEYNAFEVQYLNASDLLQNLTTTTSLTVDNLKPFHNYTFTVVVISGSVSSILRRSLPVSAIFTTDESFPGRVEKFHPIDIQPSDIVFEWYLPRSEQNGIVRKFTISYGLDSTSYMVKEFKPWEYQGAIKNLMPGKTYTFKIQAATSVGYGPETVLKQRMPIFAPPRPSSQIVPTEVRKSPTTIQIRFRKNYFSEQNGLIIAYTIIVAEDDAKNASGIEMPSWKDVQAYSVWPPYQIMDPYYPFVNATVEDFTIGDDVCDERVAKVYCNGPLRTGTTYRVKIRAFTTADKFTDTYYSFPITTDRDSTVWVIFIGILFVLTAILCVGFLMVKRRTSIKKAIAHHRRSNNDSLSIPDSIMATSRPVRLENFAEHYRIMSADSDFRFSEEFEELKHVGKDQPCTAADLPCNRPKNRFTNILPYDHSRFKLQPVDDEEGSDYVNANYVPGYNSPREFIVTQGPLHCTRDDFWRMCWESNSRAIVMLTRVVEKGREKCDHYWPYDTLPVYYGDICVTLLNDTHYPDWVISEFLLCRGDQQRVMRHFHFTTWPDFGVPNPPQTLIRFVRCFRERIATEQRPIVVHCSAGVGRSGTFIALDRILQSINHSDVVDIFGIVYAMRKERVWMVQTEQQYICIHQCLLAVLEGNEHQSAIREIHLNPAYDDDEGIAESGI